MLVLHRTKVGLPSRLTTTKRYVLKKVKKCRNQRVVLVRRAGRVLQVAMSASSGDKSGQIRTEESENLANLAKLAEQLSSSSPHKKSDESGIKKKDQSSSSSSYPSSSSFSSAIRREKGEKSLDEKSKEEKPLEEEVIIKDISYKTGIISDKILKEEKKEERKNFTATDIVKEKEEEDEEDEVLIMPPHQMDEITIDIENMTNKQMSKLDEVYNIELNWLSFNWRVLSMANETSTPLLEKLKFIAITRSNLDEFFSKRVGGLMRQREAGLSNLRKMKKRWSPETQLKLIHNEVSKMVNYMTATFYDKLLKEFSENDFKIAKFSDLNEDGKKKFEDIFENEVEPLLTPIILDPGHPFPCLPPESMNIAVLLEDPRDDEQKIECAIVNIPEPLNRWREISTSYIQDNDNLIKCYMPIEEIICHHMYRLFGGMKILGVHSFRVTRNAELERNEEQAEDLLAMISAEVRERNFAPFVRLEIDDGAPDDLIDLLTSELDLDFDEDVYRTKNLIEQIDLFDLVGLAEPHVNKALKYEKAVPCTHYRLTQQILRKRDLSRSGFSWKDRRSIFSIIRDQDILVHHPYQRFDNSTLRFVEEAASDKNVLAIKTTLYRTSSESPIIDALLKARENGKNVAVLVEIKARFDEARNVDFARRLEKAGCNVAYGLIGVKTHCKTMLVIRKERYAPNGLRTYVHIGTGNYNPTTAKLYTDFGLLTCNPDLGEDVVDLFKHLTGMHYQKAVGGYKKLIVCSEYMQQQFLDLIDKEIENAKSGKPAAICLKMNGLDESVMVEKLYEASQAGVRVDCIIRGICRLRPQVKGLSENIRVISIIGRYLEHDRLYCFHNDGKPLYYLGSADWLPRNIYKRVEVVAPVEDENLKTKLRDILTICLYDKKNAWELQSDQRYMKPATRTDEASLSAPLLGLPESTKLKNLVQKHGTHEVLLKLTEKESRTGIPWNGENADINFN